MAGFSWRGRIGAMLKLLGYMSYTENPPPRYDFSALEVVVILGLMALVVAVSIFALTRIGKRPGRPPKLHK